MQILTVLKKSAEYKPEYLYRLADRIMQHNPEAHIKCLTDTDINHPHIEAIKRPLPPRWWGKMYLFELTNDPCLYMDIDTVPIGDMSGLIRKTPGFTMISDVYRKGGFGSGIMSWFGDYSYLTEAFDSKKNQVMMTYKTSQKWGDQAFIADNLHHTPDTFDRTIRSYKKHCTQYVPSGTKVVYFHGKPRPWQVPEYA